MNTWGLRSVNTGTFNTKYHDNLWYPKEGRDVIVTLLRVHNLVLNIAGYMRFIPIVPVVSGCIRIATGLGIIAVTLAIGQRNAQEGIIIGRWYDEALITGVSQVARGILEAFVPYGWAVNAAFDVIFTVKNIIPDVANASACPGCMGYKSHEPHDDADYPFPFSILYFV